MRNIANFFIGSPEFLDTYRNLDNAGFLALLYRNVMDREGDTAGIGYWTGQLDTGEGDPFVEPVAMRAFSGSVRPIVGRTRLG